MHALQIAGRVSTFGFAVLFAIGVAGSAEAKPGGGDPTRPPCTVPGVYYPDRDKDDLSDCLETHVYGTDPVDADTDGDKLTDGEEVKAGVTSPLVFDGDSDLDGFDDFFELTRGLDPYNVDTDGDGLEDSPDATVYCGEFSGCLRVAYALTPDVDFDGLSDGREVNFTGTDCRAFDTDGDGIGDGAELSGGRYVTDPLKADTDNDGLSDDAELHNGTDPTSAFSF